MLTVVMPANASNGTARNATIVPARDFMAKGLHTCRFFSSADRLWIRGNSVPH
jgi:hypothetical protein